MPRPILCDPTGQGPWPPCPGVPADEPIGGNTVVINVHELVASQNREQRMALIELLSPREGASFSNPSTV
jgi:hypothetical protein